MKDLKQLICKEIKLKPSDPYWFEASKKDKRFSTEFLHEKFVEIEEKFNEVLNYEIAILDKLDVDL